MRNALTQRAIGAALSCVIFITNINCFCGVIQIAGQAPACCHGQCASCCAHSHPNPTKSSGQQCPHCQGTLIADHPQTPSLSPQISPAYAPLISYSTFNCIQCATTHSNIAGDNFSSLVPANSLLRQNCALIL